MCGKLPYNKDLKFRALQAIQKYNYKIKYLL